MYILSQFFMTTALSVLTQEEKSLLERDRQKMGGSHVPSLPLIRLANKDMSQAPEGEYFIEERRPDENPIVTSIGKNPEVTILYKTNTYSLYSDELNATLAWTTDIHGFTQMDAVTLFRKRDGRVTIDFDGAWPDFKKHMQEHYVVYNSVKEKYEKQLTFKTVLYVLYKGKPHKIFVSNASSVGVDEHGKPSFDKPQQHCLQEFTTMCWNEKRALYEFSVTLGSRFVPSSKPYYIMTFPSIRELGEEELSTAIRASHEAQQAITAIDSMRRQSAMTDQETHEAKTSHDLPDF